MRLINAETRKLHDFADIEIAPSFAILSHTWGEGECTLQDMNDPAVVLRPGYLKIKYCCEQALKDGLEWAWVDT
jgi:hypothetical protein